ncbi:MAG: O-antigen ligase family protein [Anaerolineae bacterium]|nr:O-antigen ligase family protein [Anaerolineae bacterium]
MKRDWFLMIVALVACAGAFFAAWGTALERDERLRGVADPATDADLPYWMPRLGINADLTLYAPDEIADQLSLMRAAGVTWVRQFFPWDMAEAEPGVFDWTRYDAIVAEVAESDGLQLVAVLNGTPPWAAVEGSSTTGAMPPNAVAFPADPADFAAYARAFAERYGDRIDVYQIWDEPNLTEAWGMGEPRAAAYAALLQAAYEAIHSADADAQVIAGALAPTVETGPKNISDLTFLDDLYRLGLADISDGVAAKPYGFSYPADDRAFDPNDPAELKFARAAALREIMLAHDDGRTPLWISEFGWNQLPDDWAGAPSIWGEVSAEQQAAYTLDALRMADDEWLWVGGAILSAWTPPASFSAPDDPRWGFALRTSDDDPTPLYDTLATRAIAVSAQADAAPPGLHHPMNAYTAYSGVWTLSELGADLGWVNDSQLDFTFEGTEVSLLLREDNYVAYLYVTIDGQPANALPTDAAGNSYIVLTSDTRQPDVSLVPVARDLPPGVHRLHLIADRGWDRWALAGFAVGAGNPAQPFDRQIALALIAGAVSLGAAAAFALHIDWQGALRPFAGLWKRLGDAGQLALSAAASILLLIGMLLTWGDATPNLFRREPIQLGLAIVTAGLMYVNPALIVTLAAAAVLLVIFFHKPLYGLTLTLFAAPFFLFPVNLYQFAFPLSEMLVVITAAAWILRLAVDWARRHQDGPDTATPFTLTSFDWLLVAYLVLGVVAVFVSTYRDQAVTELRTLFIEPVLFYAILRTMRPTRTDLLRLVDALVLAGVAVALIGLWLFLRGEAVITAEEGARRLASVYGSPNNVGLWLGRCLPFALAFALAPLDRRRRVAAIIALVIMLVAVGLTQSAGALFVGVPVGLATVLLFVFGRRAALPLAGLAGMAGLALPLLARLPRFERLLDPTEGTNFIRLRVWESALTAIQDHPLTGLGLDQFLYYYRGRYIMPDAWLEPDLSHPHNVVLDFWLRLGILGVVVFAGLVLACWRALTRARRRFLTEDVWLAALATGALGCLANLVAHGLVDNAVFVNDLVYVFVLIVGLAQTLSTRAGALKGTTSTMDT